ncbi:MAG: pentapeptide repeat-containing protein [Pirellulales bacterium]
MWAARPNLSFANQNLTGAGLSGTFTRTNFSHANLTSASLSGANLTGANLDGAILTGADIFNANLSSTHITLDQLYSTASYQEYGLYGVHLIGNDLSGANFAGKSLVSTDFYAAKLVGADFSNANLTMAEFINADLSGANLAGANLSDGSLALANLTGADLTNANLTGANLIGANLAGADIRGASLSKIIIPGTPGEYVTCKYCWGGLTYDPGTQAYSAGTGVTLAQLVSTANYGAHDLSEVKFVNNNFRGGNFAGFNLTNASFAGTTLTGANFSSDARGAIGLGWVAASNFVRPDGHIAGLNLSAGKTLSIRDYDGNPYSGYGPIPITVDQRLVVSSGGVLQMVFEADAWNSTISFAPGIPVALGGTLELAFADGVDPIGQIGRTFDLFDWTGVSPTGTFTVDTASVWNLTNLYTTGEVTFLAASGIPGDFNGDNLVDAGDYTVWRDGASSRYSPGAYTVWQNNFGATLGSGGIAALPSPAVPEPTTLFLLSIGLVAAWMTRRTPPAHACATPLGFACRLLPTLALLILACDQASAAPPEIEFTKIGAPVWKPVDFQLFSAPATPFDQEFGQVYSTLLPYDTPLVTTYVPHAPPYDNEISAGMIAGGYVSQSVFAPDAITLHPNGVYFAFMLVPDPGITGSSRDFASGPVIPNSLFPIASNIDAWLDGVLVDRLPGTDALTAIQPRDIAFQGTSHLESLQAIWHPWDDDLTVGPLGQYDLRVSIRDASGSGWDAVATFRVALPGDYDYSGTVGQEDYNLWLANFGSTTLLAADGNRDGIVNSADFSVWRDHLGASLGLGNGLSPDHGAVPEPSGLFLCAFSLVALVAIRPAHKQRR